MFNTTLKKINTGKIKPINFFIINRYEKNR